MTSDSPSLRYVPWRCVSRPFVGFGIRETTPVGAAESLSHRLMESSAANGKLVAFKLNGSSPIFVGSNRTGGEVRLKKRFGERRVGRIVRGAPTARRPWLSREAVEEIDAGCR